MRKKHSKVIPLPTKVKQQWADLVQAIQVAAHPYTGGDGFPVYAADIDRLPAACIALNKAMDVVRRDVPEAPLHGRFVVTAEGPACEISWWTSS